jgi:hypothetical protein
MQMITKNDKITRAELTSMSDRMFGSMVKAVVDIQREIMVIDAEFHADQETLLLQEDSRQDDLWGINLYPDIPSEDWIEFDSMINIRPAQNNRTRGVEDAGIRARIRSVVGTLVE